MLEKLGPKPESGPHNINIYGKNKTESHLQKFLTNGSLSNHYKIMDNNKWIFQK